MLVGLLWGSIQELELAQPEFPGGEILLESSTGLWKTPVYFTFFTKLISERLVGLFYFFPPSVFLFCP